MKFKIIIIIFSIGLWACHRSGKPDVSSLLKERKILRFDKDVFTLDKEHPDVRELRARYGHFFDIYAEGVLQLGNPTDSGFPALFSLFLKDTVICEVYDSVRTRYEDLSIQEKEFSKAFAYYRYYFPQKTIPQLYSHISGFNQSIIVDSTFISISLDNYLGENCVFYRMLATPVPAYMRRRMGEGNIVKDALFGWLGSELPYIPLQNDLVSGMLYQGKIIYLLKKILPDYPMEYLFDYTEEQLKWCKNNEKQIWDFLIENEYLFSTGQMLLRKYLYDAPFTSEMPAESPGKAVVWNGYRIIEKYMEKNGKSLEELEEEQDYHKILRLSGYRP